VLAYLTDADLRGFAEGSVALVRREGKYAKGHLEGRRGIIKRSKYCETEFMSTYIMVSGRKKCRVYTVLGRKKCEIYTVLGPKKCRVYMDSDPKKCDKLREMIRTKEFGR
jgi:hypothetical protein